MHYYEMCEECGEDINRTHAHDGDLVKCPACATCERVSMDDDGIIGGVQDIDIS